MIELYVDALLRDEIEKTDVPEKVLEAVREAYEDRTGLKW